MYAGRFGQDIALFCRADHHDHLATFHLRHVFNLADFLGVLGDPHQQITAQFLVGHLAATKPQGDFDLVAIFQKLENVTHLDPIVMDVSVRAELDLFDLDDLLLFAGFGFALLGFVLILAEIHDFDDRWFRVWRNLYQVQTGLLGQHHATRRRNNANVFTFSADQSNLGRFDPVVDTGSGVTLRRGVMGSAGYSGYPWIVDRVFKGARYGRLRADST